DPAREPEQVRGLVARDPLAPLDADRAPDGRRAAPRRLRALRHAPRPLPAPEPLRAEPRGGAAPAARRRAPAPRAPAGGARPLRRPPPPAPLWLAVLPTDVVNAADRRPVAERAVGSSPVVIADEGSQSPDPLR